MSVLYGFPGKLLALVPKSAFIGIRTQVGAFGGLQGTQTNRNVFVLFTEVLAP